MRTTTRSIAAAVAVLALLTWGTHAAAAGEDKGPANELLKELTRAHKHPDHAGLLEALQRVPDVHNGLEDKGLRKKLQGTVAKVLNDINAGNARAVAAKVLGQLNDPDGVYKHVSKAVPKPKDKEASPAQLEAMKTIALLAPEAAVAPLLKLAQKGKSLPAVKEAIVALGSYGKSKKRVAILKDLLDLMGRHHAAATSSAGKPGAAAAKTWKALGPSLVETANKLTGRSLPSAEEWLATYKEHKKKLAELFPE